jgi:hypothetical protein
MELAHALYPRQIVLLAAFIVLRNAQISAPDVLQPN